jgi:hypothetical protein
MPPLLVQEIKVGDREDRKDRLRSSEMWLCDGGQVSSDIWKPRFAFISKNTGARMSNITKVELHVQSTCNVAKFSDFCPEQQAV